MFKCRGVSHNFGNRAADIGLARNRETLVGQKRVRKAGHDVHTLLHCVPTLDGNRGTEFAVGIISHGQLQSRDPFDGFGVLRLAFHGFFDRRNGFFQLGGIGFFNFFGLELKLHHADRVDLDTELFNQFSLIADDRPEPGRTGPDLQDADFIECLDHVRRAEEIFKPPDEDGVVHTGVGNISKGNVKAPKHLPGSKQPALRIPQAKAVFKRVLVAGAPEKNRFADCLADLGNRILSTEIAVGNEHRVDIVCYEFF